MHILLFSFLFYFVWLDVIFNIKIHTWLRGLSHISYNAPYLPPPPPPIILHNLFISAKYNSRPKRNRKQCFCIMGDVQVAYKTKNSPKPRSHVWILIYRKIVSCKECFKCESISETDYIRLEVVMLIIWVQKMKRYRMIWTMIFEYHDLSTQFSRHLCFSFVCLYSPVFTLLLFWVNLGMDVYLRHFCQRSFVISKAGLEILAYRMHVREIVQSPFGIWFNL